MRRGAKVKGVSRAPIMQKRTNLPEQGAQHLYQPQTSDVVYSRDESKKDGRKEEATSLEVLVEAEVTRLALGLWCGG